MIVNNYKVDEEKKNKIKRVITENTRPDTSNNNVNLGYNNLNSVLKNVGDDQVVQYIKIPKIETVQIDKGIINEITHNNKNNKDKICLKTNINKNSKTNIDLYFSPKRMDRFGTPITHGGKHRVTFIDRLTKNNFIEVIKVESFKDYNKMEEVSINSKKNLCCIIT